MFHWQTLTLARVSYLGFQIGRSQRAAIRSLLYAIGEQHFPEPSVGCICQDSNGADLKVNISWTVEDRSWSILVDLQGHCTESKLTQVGSVSDSQPLEWKSMSGSANLCACVQWLLFGKVFGIHRTFAKTHQVKLPAESISD